MSEAVITLKDIRKSYGKHEVLKGVNMTVNKGDILIPLVYIVLPVWLATLVFRKKELEF